jgi:hypothetical protein
MTPLTKALNEVLALLRADAEYGSALAVRVNFYPGPGLIVVKPCNDEKASLGEEEAR